MVAGPPILAGTFAASQPGAGSLQSGRVRLQPAAHRNHFKNAAQTYPLALASVYGSGWSAAAFDSSAATATITLFHMRVSM